MTIVVREVSPLGRIQADSSTAESQGNGFSNGTHEMKTLNVQDGQRPKKEKMTAIRGYVDGEKKKTE